jgi:hypothetical protein
VAPLTFRRTDTLEVFDGPPSGTSETHRQIHKPHQKALTRSPVKRGADEVERGAF